MIPEHQQKKTLYVILLFEKKKKKEEAAALDSSYQFCKKKKITDAKKKTTALTIEYIRIDAMHAYSMLHYTIYKKKRKKKRYMLKQRIITTYHIEIDRYCGLLLFNVVSLSLSQRIDCSNALP